MSVAGEQRYLQIGKNEIYKFMGGSVPDVLDVGHFVRRVLDGWASVLFGRGSDDGWVRDS